MFNPRTGLIRVHHIQTIIILLLSAYILNGQCDPDTQAPTAVCYADVNISLGPSGNLVLEKSFFDGGSFDNCSSNANLTFSFNPAQVDCSDIGAPLNVLVTVMDEAGNSNLCSSTVNVEDKIAPTAVCHANVNLSLGVSGSLTLQGSFFDAGSFDNCANLTYSINPSEVDCSDIGTPVPITVTISDDSGNTNVCTSTGHVEDKLSPNAQCHSLINVSLGASGMITLDPKDYDNGSSDNCTSSENLVFSASFTDFTCADLGDTASVLVTVTDESGNSSSCNTILVIEDKIAPTAVCHANVNLSLGVSGSLTLQGSFFDGGSFDNCSSNANLTFSFNPAQVDCSDIGAPLNVLVTVMDEAGNSNLCSSTVNVEDKIAPTAVCHANVNLSLGVSGSLTLQGSFFDAGSFDNCANLTYSINPSEVDCSDIGTPVPITVTISDDSGYTNVCTSTGHVEDKLSPNAQCHSLINVSLGASGMITLDPKDYDNGSSDNCTSSENLVFSASFTDFTCADLGDTASVLVTVTDENGNSSSCNTIVVVEDKMPPAILCASEINVSLGASGTAILDESFFGVVSSDNCTSGENLTFSIGPSSVDCADIGSPVNVVITVSDEFGNSSVCNSIVNVEDKILPTIVCEPSTVLQLGDGGIVNIDPILFLQSFSDNCDLNVTANPTTLDCSDLGNNTVTITATDQGGNTVSCTANVFVLNPNPDNCNITGPTTITCGQTDILFNATTTGGNGPFTYDWVLKKGAADGWVITSGLGTASIIMDAGTKKLDLRLTITDVCGKKVKCKYTATCIDPAGRQTAIQVSSSGQDVLRSTETAFFSIYPNPALDILNVTSALPNDGSVQIRIVDSAGKVKKSISNGAAKIEISNLQPGIYFILISDNFEIVQTSKFIKLE